MSNTVTVFIALGLCVIAVGVFIFFSILTERKERKRVVQSLKLNDFSSFIASFEKGDIDINVLRDLYYIFSIKNYFDKEQFLL